MSDDSNISVPAPRANATLLGHDEAERDILSAWNAERMHHAWLITGKRGIGKATLAYRVARFVLSGCGESGGLFGPPDNLDISPDHPVLNRIAQGSHGDLRVIERQWDDKKKRRKGEIVVDDVRGIGQFLSLTPAEGGWRVVIVDAADEMNRNAANAVLKVLEEPPKRAVLLLLAHTPSRLLPTIRSRCRSLPLAPLDDAVVEELLRRYRADLPADDVRALVHLAEGSVGRALDLSEQGGLQLYQSLIGLLRSLPKLDVPAAYTFSEKAGRSDDSFRVTTELFQWWLGRTIAAAARGEEPAEVVPGENGLMRTLVAAAALDKWLEVWEKISRLFDRAQAVNLDKRQVLVSAFLSVERLVRP